MNTLVRIFLAQIVLCTGLAAPMFALESRVPSGVDPHDALFQLGLLDVTKTPCRADSTSSRDATKAIQQAVYAFSGNITLENDRGVVELVDSTDVTLTNLRSFHTGRFYTLSEKHGGKMFTVASDTGVGLLRNGNRGEHKQP
jgi:hypothetical protein